MKIRVLSNLLLQKILRMSGLDENEIALPTITMPLSRSGWKVKELEVVNSQVCLEMFQTSGLFQDIQGGPKWEFEQEGGDISIGLEDDVVDKCLVFEV